ncbi:phosphatidate cytidylyltransferase [Candidatus Vallotia tarda]|uniref:Phosphatidate cytidylyltransferase n=1 Tax=Candidatus Vallotiella hemipterorum TaxID=1177213 RepID=A0A916JVP8_9BURK|nr:phosphatidate cytidylyltransferase [Candidatus Vallotia tarda]CAG7602187.1 Phosphatidate cytidylyltransferase [Candidatus Vallotia tarda]
MLKIRMFTAISLLAILLPATLFLPLSGFSVLIACVLVFAAWEWGKLLQLSGVWPFYYSILSGVILVSYMLAGAPLGNALLRVAAAFWIVIAPFILLRKPILASGVWRIFMLVSGVVLFIACWHALIAARVCGVIFVLSLLCIVCLADSGAYFVGKLFSQHKLAPAISPSKTWEGAVGGWLLTIMGALLAFSANPSLLTVTGFLIKRLGALGAVLILSLLIVFSIVGDLFESLLKRQAGVKDASQLLPGHGGMLDRIDSLLPVLPLAMLLLS